MTTISFRAGAAAEMATKRKHLKYTKLKEMPVPFVVIAVETSGVWSEESKEIIHDIGKRLRKKKLVTTGHQAFSSKI